MSFWMDFGLVYEKVFGILQTPMTFGGFTFSFLDVFLVSGAFIIIKKVVSGIINNEIEV